MKGHWIRYNSAELAWVEANATLPRTELHARFVQKFGRDDVAVDHLVSLRKRKGWKTGRDGRFPKGTIPPNKGRFGYCAPGAEKGWFRKGERRGVATRLYKPIGTERVSRDGYLERKVNDDLPLQRRWRPVHRIRWEEVNGPVPEGHALKCLDSNKLNTDPSNWEAVPRALLPRLAGGGNRRGKRILPYDEAPAEMKPALLAVAKIEHKVRELSASKARRQKGAP